MRASRIIAVLVLPLAVAGCAVRGDTPANNARISAATDALHGRRERDLIRAYGEQGLTEAPLPGGGYELTWTRRRGGDWCRLTAAVDARGVVRETGWAASAGGGHAICRDWLI